MALRLHGLSRHPIELRQQRVLAALNRKLLQLLIQVFGLLPTLLHAGADQLKGQKQGPLAFDAFKASQLLGLVVQACAVLHHGLMAIAAEAAVAIAAAQLPVDGGLGAGAQLITLNTPRGVANYRQAPAIDLLAGRFPRQQSLQGAPEAQHRIGRHPKDVAAVAMGPKGIQASTGLQGRFHQANRAGIALGGAVVALVAALPNAVIRHPVGAAEVIDQVLHKGGLGRIGHHHQA